MFRLSRFLTIIVLSFPWKAASAEIIYQAFEEKFSDITARLSDLKAEGFSTILVSPPQKSLDRPDWRARYQPVDYRVIEGPLGNEDDLRKLITAAHEHGLKIIVDAVLNHMADDKYFPDLRYPEFSAKDFHFPDTRPCIDDPNDRYKVTHQWLCDEFSRLPDLDTSSAYVRSVHHRYLQKLVDMGVDGFRFDAAGNIESDYFPAVLAGLPSNLFNIGELIWAQEYADVANYSKSMALTDFLFLGDLIRAFSFDGDLRSLIPKNTNNTPSESAVRLVRNHDTVFNSQFFAFHDRSDAVLAYAFVLAKAGGNPLIFNQDADEDTVRAGIDFHRKMNSQPEKILAINNFYSGPINFESAARNQSNFIAVQRGDAGLMILNKSSEWLDLPSVRLSGMQPGCYSELRYGFFMKVLGNNDGCLSISSWAGQNRDGINIGPRTSMFFVHTDC